MVLSAAIDRLRVPMRWRFTSARLRAPFRSLRPPMGPTQAD